MTDDEIADALVSAGILEASRSKLVDTRYFFPGFMDSLSSNSVVCDWRVAGACLERIDEWWACWCKNSLGLSLLELFKSPRSICEAFANAVSEGPHCIPPDEVGDSGVCVCDGSPEDIGRQRQEAGWACPGCPNADGSNYMRDCAWPDCLQPPAENRQTSD